ERPATAPSIARRHHEWSQVNDLVNDLIGDVVDLVNSDSACYDLPKRPHTACAGVHAIPIMPAAESWGTGSENESDGGSLDWEDDNTIPVPCATGSLSTSSAVCSPDFQDDEKSQWRSLTKGEFLLLGGMPRVAGVSQQDASLNLDPAVSSTPAKVTARQKPLGALPFSLSTRLPRTNLFVNGGHGMAPQASRFKSHSSWKDFLPMRTSSTSGQLGDQRRMVKSLRPSAGYPEAPEEQGPAHSSLELHPTKGPKYRVAPGASRPVRARAHQSKVEQFVLEFRSEPRVIPARRLHAKAQKELRVPDLSCQKHMDLAPLHRFRPHDTGWAREREALAQG
ncbi:unnamed protein product, partial [Symbiodinium pilosum]